MKYILYSLGLLVLCAVAGVFIWIGGRPSPILLQGEVNAKQVQVSPRVVGQVQEIFVEEGRKVKKGEWLTKLDAPTIRAKEVQAEAAVKAADAQRNKVFAGARVEEVTALKNVYQKSLAAERLAYKTYERVKSLFDDGIVPAQQLDESFTRWQAAKNDMNAAMAQYEIGKIGARPEDKNAATAMAEQASGALQEVTAYVNDTILASPIDGEVSNIVVNVGELVTPGFPVLSIVDMNDVWVTFNIRENLLKHIEMGTIINVLIPAISNKDVYPIEVRYISPLGDYAVWSATKTRGDFDLKTFEIKAYPKQDIPGLRAGMSAIFYIQPE